MRHDHTSARHGEQWRDHWRTRRGFVRVVESCLRVKFTLDAAATPHNRVCARHLGPGSDIMTDALRHGADSGKDWSKSAGDDAIWLNPPYSELGSRPWIDAAVVASTGRSVVACLVPARPSCRWSQRLIMAASTILIPIGRLSFELPHDIPEARQSGAGAPGDTWVVVLDGNPGNPGPVVRYIPRSPVGDHNQPGIPGMEDEK